MLAVTQVLLAATHVLGNWVYTWPYSKEGDCSCRHVDVESPMGWSDESTCLTNFALEEYEYCRHGDLGGISEHDCDSVVSISESMTNTDCRGRCMRTVAGTLSQEELLAADCKVETVVTMNNRALPLPQTGCFTNFVLGHADFLHPDTQRKPLNVFHDVDSPAECQTLCQESVGCAWFQYRALPDDCSKPTSDDQQSLPNTCVLYDYQYVNDVMSVDPEALDVNHDLCDTARFENECGDLFNTEFWFPLRNSKCLSCSCSKRCVFKVFTHVTGPAYCTGELVTDLCTIPTPVPHTTTAVTCATSECLAPTTATLTAVGPPVSVKPTTATITAVGPPVSVTSTTTAGDEGTGSTTELYTETATATVSPAGTSQSTDRTRPATQPVLTTSTTTGLVTESSSESSTRIEQATSTAPVQPTQGPFTSTESAGTASSTQPEAANTTTAEESTETTTTLETTTQLETEAESTDSVPPQTATLPPPQATKTGGEPPCPCPCVEDDCNGSCDYSCLDAQWEQQDLKQ